jgi:hypothetical protein
MLVMEGGLDGQQILALPQLCSPRCTRQRAALPKSEVLLQMSPIITPGALPLVLPILKETPTVMNKNTSTPWLLSLRQPVSQHISLWILVSNIFRADFVRLLIVFQARNGVQPTAQNAWGDWCNLKGTGFGVRPTTNTGDPLEDAFVWVKPGGECDVSRLLSYTLIFTDVGKGNF